MASFNSTVARKLATTDSSVTPLVVVAAYSTSIFPKELLLRHILSQTSYKSAELPVISLSLEAHHSPSPSCVSLREHYMKWLAEDINDGKFISAVASTIGAKVRQPSAIALQDFPALVAVAPALAAALLSAIRSNDFVKAVGIPCIIAAPAASMLYDLKSTANVFCSLASATEKGDALLEGRKFIASAECEVTTKNKSGKTHQQRFLLGIDGSGKVIGHAAVTDVLCDYAMFVKKDDHASGMKVTRMQLDTAKEGKEEGSESKEQQQQGTASGLPSTSIGYDEGSKAEPKQEAEGQMSKEDLQRAAAAASKAAASKKASGATSEVSTGVPGGVLVYVEPEDSDNSSESSDDDDLDL